MSRQASEKKALKLLQKIVQDDEDNSEQKELLENVIKENRYKLTKNMKKDKSKNGERKSRPRTKDRDIESNNDTLERSRSHSDSRSSRSSSVSVSSRSRSRSRSRSSSYSRSRSRSRSSSRSRSGSRSRTPDGTSTSEPKHQSKSRSSSRSRSRSPKANRITVKYTPVVKDKKNETPETLSTNDSFVKQEKGYSEIFVSGHGHLRNAQKDEEKPKTRPRQHTKKKKLLNRSPIRKFKSLEINPDVFIEDKLKQKYEELDQLMSRNRVSDPKIHVTRQHYHQMQVLRDQYVNVSHGLPPSGVLIPRSLPGKTRPHSATLPIRKTRRPWSGDSYSTTNTYNGSEFGEDVAYHTIHNVVHATAARNQGKIQEENGIPFKVKSKKKKLRKRKDSESTQDSRPEKHNEDVPDNCSKTTDGDGSLSTLTPRDNIHIPADYHLKNCNNEKLLQWLKVKDKEYRRQKRADKEKKKEERQKKVLDANEKFERMLESEKKVKQWMSKKKKEEIHKRKVERETSRNRLDITLPGKSLGIRPISPGPRVMRKNFGNESVEFEQETSQETKLDNSEPNETNTVGPHPPNSKFIYKRPVAGSIKLRIKNRPQSSPPTRISKETKDLTNKAKEAERMQKMRMSYDDWLKKKHQDDIERKKNERKQKELMSKSDPELNKIIPDIAKKRIHNVLEGKKRIDTGIPRFDNEKNKEFGGGDFQSEHTEDSDDEEKKTRCSYRLEEDRVRDLDDTSESKLKVAGTGIQKPGSTRPQTAPARVNKVPAPKQSSSSPRKAVVPSKADDIMSNEDKSNPFRLPFPSEEGVPKHVASRQRKLFAEKTWQKLEDEERPEPQGCDSAEPPLCLSGSTGNTAGSQDKGIKDNNKENGSKKEQSSYNGDISNKTKEAKENINNNSKNIEDESIVSNSSAFLTQEVIETKSFLDSDTKETSLTMDDNSFSNDEIDSKSAQDHETESKDQEKTESKDQEKTESKDQEKENMEKLDENAYKDNSVENVENKDPQTDDNADENSNAKEGYSSEEGEKNNDTCTKTDESVNDNSNKNDVKLLGLNNLEEKDISTSRSSKHVSFRDETEVFGEGDQIVPPDLEWSTDTETPDDDNYQRLGDNQETNTEEDGKVDSSIDSYGNELDNNSPRVNEMRTSTDDEF